MRTNSNVFSPAEQSAIHEFIQATHRFGYQLMLTRAYYQSVPAEVIDRMLDMLERAGRSVEGDCFIHAYDSIYLHHLIQLYESGEACAITQKLGAFYLHMLSKNCEHCRRLLQQILQHGGEVHEDIDRFFLHLQICLRTLAVYEAKATETASVLSPRFSLHHG